MNPINCVGVMGKGLALEMKTRFPDMFNKYKELCDKHLITIGKLWLYHSNITNQSILNFPTKQHWKHDSQYEFIELGMKKILGYIPRKTNTINSLPITRMWKWKIK